MHSLDLLEIIRGHLQQSFAQAYGNSSNTTKVFSPHTGVVLASKGVKITVTFISIHLFLITSTI